MKFLSALESAKVFGYANAGSALGKELRVDFSKHLDRTAPLARLLMSIIGNDQPKFLWIREFGIWPSLENWDLFNGLRAASGEDQSLSDAPGHDFAPDELERSISYLQVTMLNGWGGVLIGKGSRSRIAISHDSWLSIRPSSQPVSEKALIDEFGLPSRTEEAPRSLLTMAAA